MASKVPHGSGLGRWNQRLLSSPWGDSVVFPPALSSVDTGRRDVTISPTPSVVGCLFPPGDGVTPLAFEGATTRVPSPQVTRASCGIQETESEIGRWRFDPSFWARVSKCGQLGRVHIPGRCPW